EAARGPTRHSPAPLVQPSFNLVITKPSGSHAFGAWLSNFRGVGRTGPRAGSGRNRGSTPVEIDRPAIAACPLTANMPIALRLTRDLARIPCERVHAARQGDR